MTREEAIKEIQDASDYEVRHGDIEHHHEDIMRRVEAFEKAVNALQKEPEWIPTSKRLPEGNEKVLVCGVEAINNSRVYAVKNWDADTWRPLSAPSVKWIAWMPFPEPYEEREGREE